MKRFFEFPPVRLLSSIKLGIILLVIFAVVIAKATFLESQYGAVGSRALVYGTLWFEILLGLICLNLLLQLFKNMPYKARQTGFVIVHIAMIWILVSAGITRFFGYEGMMPIREGQSVDYVWSTKTYLQLAVGDEQGHFPVSLYRPGPQHIAHNVTLGGKKYRMAVEEYWPHYKLDYAESDSGPAALKMTTAGGAGPQQVWLLDGEAQQASGLTLRLVEGALPAADDGGDARWGHLRVHVGDDTGGIDVPQKLPAEFEVGGWKLAVTEFQTDYKMGAGTNYQGAMTNPMIRVAFTDPQGRQGERALFAYHPDFAMTHGGGGQDFPELHLLYAFDRGLVFARTGDGLKARASLAMDRVDMGSGDVDQAIPAGQPFDVADLTLYRAADGGFQFVLQDVLDHVKLQPHVSDDEHDPAAARVKVTGPDGAGVERVVFKHDDRGTSFTLDGAQATVTLGPVKIPLPYSIRLDEFVLINYPGSRNPASYESHVRLFDPEEGIDGRPVRIYMNHPLTHRGRKHFQSSYDTDEKGTVLSVNYDPGKWPTYIGYMLISLGFILIFARDLIWPDKRDALDDRRLR